VSRSNPPGAQLQKLYYRIGEVASIVGVEPHVLRYWESEFRSIRPQKSARGQRIYSRRDVETLLKVKELLYGHRFTIAGAKQRLRQGGVEPVTAFVRSTDDEPSALVELPPSANDAAPEGDAPMGALLSARVDGEAPARGEARTERAAPSVERARESADRALIAAQIEVVREAKRALLALRLEIERDLAELSAPR
jgi:DNA-binding transcriptional MerR regulator